MLSTGCDGLTVARSCAVVPLLSNATFRCVHLQRLNTQLASPAFLLPLGWAGSVNYSCISLALVVGSLSRFGDGSH